MVKRLEELKKTGLINSLRGSFVGDFLRYIKEVYISNCSFIHINKTGGSSIEYALNIPHRHDTALEKKERVGKDRFKNKFKFTIVRNPFDRAVSHWRYRVENGRFGGDFSDWVEDKYANKNIKIGEKKFFMPQMKWITNRSENVIVDYIGRFERINEDYHEIKERIGGGGKLPHLKKTERKEYREYYNEEDKIIVEDYFRIDLEYLEYEF